MVPFVQVITVDCCKSRIVGCNGSAVLFLLHEDPDDLIGDFQRGEEGRALRVTASIFNDYSSTRDQKFQDEDRCGKLALLRQARSTQRTILPSKSSSCLPRIAKRKVPSYQDLNRIVSVQQGNEGLSTSGVLPG